MNEQLRAKAGLVYNVVESVILAMSVGMLVWVGNLAIQHSSMLAAQEATASATIRRVDILESIGSRPLGEHEKEDNARIAELRARLEKVEAAVLALQTAPGELKAISVRLDGLRDGQSRVEKLLDEHIKINSGKSQ